MNKKLVQKELKNDEESGNDQINSRELQNELIVIYGHYILQPVFEPQEWIYFMLLADGEEGIDYGRSLCCLTAF